MSPTIDVYKSPMNDPGGYLTYDQVKGLIWSAKNIRDRTLLILLFHSGRRISEVIGRTGITVSDINFSNGLITWRILKKRHARTIILPIDNICLSELSDYIDAYHLRMSDYLFKLSPSMAWRIIVTTGSRAVEANPNLYQYYDKTYIINKKPVTLHIIKVGRRGIHPHTLRHSAAIYMTKLFKNNIKKTRDMLDHSDINQTATYLNYTDNETKDDLNKGFKD
jgi:integrase